MSEEIEGKDGEGKEGKHGVQSMEIGVRILQAMVNGRREPAMDEVARFLGGAENRGQRARIGQKAEGKGHKEPEAEIEADGDQRYRSGQHGHDETWSGHHGERSWWHNQHLPAMSTSDNHG